MLLGSFGRWVNFGRKKSSKFTMCCIRSAMLICRAAAESKSKPTTCSGFMPSVMEPRSATDPGLSVLTTMFSIFWRWSSWLKGVQATPLAAFVATALAKCASRRRAFLFSLRR